jgi:hypothetical protein
VELQGNTETDRVEIWPGSIPHSSSSSSSDSNRNNPFVQQPLSPRACAINHHTTTNLEIVASDAPTSVGKRSSIALYPPSRSPSRKFEVGQAAIDNPQLIHTHTYFAFSSSSLGRQSPSSTATTTLLNSLRPVWLYQVQPQPNPRLPTLCLTSALTSTHLPHGASFPALCQPFDQN